MLVISFKFPTGKYHATPWNRHVNEGAVEWPPSSWRVLRALIAVYYRTIDETQYSESLLKSLINQLSEEIPEYAVPRSGGSHTRHFMPTGKHSTGLVYDAFAILDPNDEIIMVWRELSLSRQREIDLLDELLKNISYLGRTESLVDARRIKDWNGTTNCKPAGKDGGKVETTVITLMVPMAHLRYDGWKLGFQEAVSIKKLPDVKVPENVFEALLVNTNDLEKDGWNQPAGAIWLNYSYVPVAETRRRRYIAPEQKKMTIARWQVIGKPLPRILNAVLISDALRATVIKWCDKKSVLPVPTVLTGRDEEGKILSNGHNHAFYFAEDYDDDGYIDHMVLYVPDGIPSVVWSVLEALPELAIYLDGNLQRWQILLEGTGDSYDFSGLSLMKKSKVWESATPYLHPWHVHKNGGFGVKEQLAKELTLKGYKDFTVIQVATIKKKGKQLKPWQFNLKRRKKNDVSPDTSGSFWRIEFNESIQGPISLGHSCHFGLGLFKPM